ncbi:alpha/beta hydrolase [Actinomadura namibiensis]|uniref:alpha/beta hydrolase n=1 Tax=Actinomadura kijaniata TaxID=46161 RepID=UPI00360E788D
MKRLRASIAAVPVLLAAFLTTPSARAEVVAPEFTDGSGLTVVGDAVSDPKDPASGFVITVTTPEVAGKHPIRIILPADYATSPTKRYPVLYLLHGTGDNPTNPSLAYPAIRSTIARSSMITVIPDGGLRGWYNDWLMQNTAAGAQKWETFHLTQVIPFIDANLRTIGTKQGRAIAGISMGGFGALHYAQRGRTCSARSPHSRAPTTCPSRTSEVPSSPPNSTRRARYARSAAAAAAERVQVRGTARGSDRSSPATRSSARRTGGAPTEATGTGRSGIPSRTCGPSPVWGSRSTRATTASSNPWSRPPPRTPRPAWTDSVIRTTTSTTVTGPPGGPAATASTGPAEREPTTAGRRTLST